MLCRRLNLESGERVVHTVTIACYQLFLTFVLLSTKDKKSEQGDRTLRSSTQLNYFQNLI